MPVTQTNENLTQNFIRAFTQRGGPAPNNPYRFAGMDEQYLMVGDISRPDRGGINAINVNDPQVRGLFKQTGITIDAPDIPSAEITFKQKFGGIPWYKFRLNCPINIYESEGLCNDPADPLNGWLTMNVLSRGLSSDKTYAGRTPFDGSDESTAAVQFSWLGDVYSVGGIPIGEVASVEVTTEVVDGVYGGFAQCSDCGPGNDGTQWIYQLQQTAGGSSAVNGVVEYTTNGGRTWAASAITGLAIGSLVTAIDIVGQYLVVVSKTENAYYVSQINQMTGVPGTWTKVSSGFVAAKTPNDMFVESPSRVYFVADGGYIYLSTDILSGVSVLSAAGTTSNNLNRIHGGGGVLLAVGASNTIIKSTNRGVSWAATAAGVTGAHSAVAVKTVLEYWVGTLDTSGKVWYTLDGGASWTQQVLPGAALTAIQDIVWPTAEAGYIAATRTGPTAALFATVMGGALWGENNTSRLPGNLPTFGRANRLAVPRVPDVMVAANNIAISGLGGGLVDGIILIGQSPVL
jgi:photosystem II stability/assembly factor-like uncharacterized protein